VAWNYIEKARKPIGLWAWKRTHMSARRRSKVLHNHIIRCRVTRTAEGDENARGMARDHSLLRSVVYGNEIAYKPDRGLRR
jgi:hypothetical protein